MPRLDQPKKTSVRTHMESYLSGINETPLLDANQERELAYRVDQGDLEARDHLVRANLRLVVNIARKYMGRGAELPDLISEGNLGLIHAIELFDPSMNVRLSTYASYWIKQSLKRAVMNTGPSVRIPAYLVELLNKWRRAIAILQDRLGRPPSENEVAGELSLTRRQVRLIQQALRINTISSQTEVQGEKAKLEEVLDDRRQASPDTRSAQADDLRQVLDQLEKMDPRAATVLRLRFGLSGEEPLTLGSIGERLGLTRERVRQIEKHALAALRDHLRDE